MVLLGHDLQMTAIVYYSTNAVICAWSACFSRTLILSASLSLSGLLSLSHDAVRPARAASAAQLKEAFSPAI